MIGKRYRSMRRSFYMTVPRVGRIMWADFRYPPKGHPPCTDQRIIEHIESRRGFGGRFWEEMSPDDVLIEPQAVPPDCEAAHLERAAKQLVSLGLNLNPKFLKKDEEPEEEVEAAEPLQLPAKTTITTMRRGELEELIALHGWDVDLSMNVGDLKKAVREVIDAAAD